MKYVVVTGGVVSGLGKGITASSVGLLLKECGLRVTAIKIDPYLNIDAGTMSPYEHGEVFVLDDGGEVDLDLGNYERFMDVKLTKDHNITTGKVYQKVIEKERQGKYLGKTVQMIPHITNEIQDWITRVANIPVLNTQNKHNDDYYGDDEFDDDIIDDEDESKHNNNNNNNNNNDFDDSSNNNNNNSNSPSSNRRRSRSNNSINNNNNNIDDRPEICIIELGGTVGDIESMVFLEALRQFEFRVGRDNFCHIHVSLIPVLGNVGEQKSKPTQHSMSNLRQTGLIPNIIVCRCKNPIDRSIAEKVSLFSMVPFSHVISVHDVSNIYFVPNLLLKQGVVTKILDILKINKMPPINIGKFDELAIKLKEQSDFEETQKNRLMYNHNNNNNDQLYNNNSSDDESVNNNNNMSGDVNSSSNESGSHSHSRYSINHNKIKDTISIGIVGKYTGLSDSYLSVTKALLSASLNCNLKLKIVWIESSHLEYYNGNKNKNINDSNSHSSSRKKRHSKPSKSRSNSANSSSSHKSSRSNSLNTSEEPPNKRQRLISMNEENDDNLKDILNYSEYLTKSNINYDCKTTSDEFLSAWNKLSSVDGILIPGGFGDRGIEGKIAACKYARVNKIPFLGICLGMQMSVIEFGRNVCNLNDCNSEEISPKCKNKVVIYMPEMINKQMGGTMRLGKRVCLLKKNSLAYYLYNNKLRVYERHRHRYEVNPKFINLFEKNGLLFTGKDDKKERMEIIELNKKIHPFYFACQFHPEFISSPLRPSPPFTGLIKAASGLLDDELLTETEDETNEENILFSDKNNNNNNNNNEIVIGENEKSQLKDSKGGERVSKDTNKSKSSSVLTNKSLNVGFENDDKQNESAQL